MSVKEIFPFTSIDFRELIEIKVLCLTDSKDVSKYSQLIARKLGNHPELKHLKKVRKINDEFQLIICKKEQEKIIFPIIEEQLNNKELIYKDVLVPKHTPKLKSHFDYSNSIWPTYFFENRNDYILSPEIIDEINKFMVKAIEQAKIGISLGFIGIGGVIVHSSTKKILAVSYDKSRNRDNEIIGHPLRHCIMNLINAISIIRDDESNPLKFYLCSECEIYVTREPCMMCAMALVHSRIEKIVFGSNNLEGALKTKYLLSNNTSLNHHFKVFESALEPECLKLLKL